MLTERGLRVFLDLKWHDIPNTVAEAVTAARALGVVMATVHTLGGAAMMEAAAVAADGRVGLVGVTVLTSHDPASYARAVGTRARSTSRARWSGRAGRPSRAGLAGVVCSPQEVALVRARVGPEALDRRARASAAARMPAGDQVRVATASEAVAAGATHLVVGRPILQAADPSAAFRGLLEEAQCIGS